VTLRNPNPFTPRRVKFIDALSGLIKEIDNPDNPDVSVSYEYRIENLKGFGQIPKIKFFPHGKDVWYKAEVMRKAGLVNKETESKIEALRKQIGFDKSRDEEHRVLARAFESEWNNLMHQLTKATRALAYVNYALSKQDKRLAEPVKMIQRVVLQDAIKTD